jgi:hypothetical protein
VGRFRFEALCTAGTELLVSADGFPVVTSCALDSEPDRERVLVRLPAACHLRVRLDDPDFADSLRIDDANGEALDLSIQLGALTFGSTAVHLGGGVSDVIVTDERARTLVLHAGGEEVARVPLRLVPGEVNEVRF